MGRFIGKGGIPGLAALSTAVVMVAVTTGLRVPKVGQFPAFAPPGAVDYSAVPPGGFAPLDPRLVSKVLGSAALQPPVSVAASVPSLAGNMAEPVERVVRHAFTNDDFEKAYPIRSVPFTADTDTSTAGRQAGEPSDCESIGGTAWYRYDARRNVGLQADTFGSNHATAIGVYQGRDFDDLELIGGEDGCANLEARGKAVVTFPAVRGQRYYFQVVGTGAGGQANPLRRHLVFSLQLQGITTLASALPDGSPGDGDSILPSLSHDGRYLLFTSGARSYRSGATPCMPVSTAAPCADLRLFLRDRVRHRITHLDKRPLQLSMVSKRVPTPLSFTGGLSADGRFATFWSSVADYAEGDTNETFDVFIRDNRSAKISLVSAAPTGLPGNGLSAAAFQSSDGRYVAFGSLATDLVAGESDTNGVFDVFVRDVVRGVTTRASVPDPSVPLSDANGGQAFAPAYGPAMNFDYGSIPLAISGNGRYVMFMSGANNLVPGDEAGFKDVFVRDLVAGRTIRVNVPDPTVPVEDQNGGWANGHTHYPINTGMRLLSDDGRIAVFHSEASNLVPGDTNDREDIFARDLVTGRTTLVSVAWNGAQANVGTAEEDPLPYIRLYGHLLMVLCQCGVGTVTPNQYSASADGRYVVFASEASNLVPGDDNQARDIFLRDLVDETTTRISVASSGHESEIPSANPMISGDGRFVAFASFHRNLAGDSPEGVPVDLLPLVQIYVRELPGARAPTGWY